MCEECLPPHCPSQRAFRPHWLTGEERGAHVHPGALVCTKKPHMTKQQAAGRPLDEGDNTACSIGHVLWQHGKAVVACVIGHVPV